MPDIPTTEPLEFVSGVTLQWRREDLTGDYPASAGWSLTYAFRGQGGKLDVTATADGDEFAITVAASDNTLAAGRYHWAAFVAKAAERYQVDSGVVEVKADLAAEVAGYDVRSTARQTLEAIEAVILGRAGKDQQAYQIEGRRLDRTPIPDLIALRDRYRAIVNSEEQAERVAAGLAPKGRIAVRFGGG